MSAKKSAKGKAAKKAAPAKKAAKSKKPVASFHMDDPDQLGPLVLQSRTRSPLETATKMALAVRQTVDKIVGRSAQYPLRLYTLAEMRARLDLFDNIAFQYMIGSAGFNQATRIEIVAEAGAGITEFLFHWIGQLMRADKFCAHIECNGEQKQPKDAARLMGTDRKLAKVWANATLYGSARTLTELDDLMRTIATELRQKCDAIPETKGHTVYIFVDKWDALMNAAEAVGNSNYGVSPSSKKKEEAKDTVAGSNFGHSKHATGFARWSTSLCETYNCTLVFTFTQRAKIDMKARPTPSYMQPGPDKNDTRLGGEAFKAAFPYRFTMIKQADVRSKEGDKQTIGHHVRFTCIKSPGPRNRKCDATVFYDQFSKLDTKTYQSPAFTFADRTAAWFVSRKLLGTTVEKDLYTCDALGCVAVTAEVFMAALQAHPEHLNHVGSVLEIDGYAQPELPDGEPVQLPPASTSSTRRANKDWTQGAIDVEATVEPTEEEGEDEDGAEEYAEDEEGNEEEGGSQYPGVVP